MHFYEPEKYDIVHNVLLQYIETLIRKIYIYYEQKYICFPGIKRVIFGSL